MTNKNKLDVSAIFLTYMALIGDSERTALAFDLETKQVEELAEAEGWREKIRRVSIMSKSGRPGDFERAQNRAMCFVQAHQVRQQLDRLLHEVANLDTEEFLARTSVRTRDGGSQLSAKFLCDIAQAAEACHRMTYMALNDTVSEREERREENGNKPEDIHSAIIASLSNPTAVVPPMTALLEETNEKLQQLTCQESKVSVYSPERGPSHLDGQDC